MVTAELLPPRTAVGLRQVSRVHGRGDGAVTALAGVSLDFEEGSFTAVMGPSGSGKSTLLRCAAGLENPTAGTVLVGDVDLTSLREPYRTIERRRRVGFVFQAYNLVDALTVRQNVELPGRLAGQRPDRRTVREALARVGMEHRARARPAQLSGGQQQRVAIARALATRPPVVMADEPTGALDQATGHAVLDLLRGVVDNGRTVVVVTHDADAAARADRVVFLVDGRISAELRAPTVADVHGRLDVIRDRG